MWADVCIIRLVRFFHKFRYERQTFLPVFTAIRPRLNPVYGFFSRFENVFISRAIELGLGEYRAAFGK